MKASHADEKSEGSHGHDGRTDPKNYKREMSTQEKGSQEDILKNLLRAQIEYLFSDAYLANEKFLLARMAEDQSGQGWVKIASIANMLKVKQLTTDHEVIAAALTDSSFLEIHKSGTKLRRPNFKPPPMKPKKDLRRTVFVYGLPKEFTHEQLTNLLGCYGNICKVYFSTETDGPNIEIGGIIMRRKFKVRQLDGSTPVEASPLISAVNLDLLSLKANLATMKTAFVVFESQGQATKCVKARSRQSSDGIRTMHKYDYNKAVKKTQVAKLKGVAPVFSPGFPSSDPPPASPLLLSSSPPHLHVNVPNGLNPNSPVFVPRSSKKSSRSPTNSASNGNGSVSSSPAFGQHGQGSQREAVQGKHILMPRGRGTYGMHLQQPRGKSSQGNKSPGYSPSSSFSQRSGSHSPGLKYSAKEFTPRGSPGHSAKEFTPRGSPGGNGGFQRSPVLNPGIGRSFDQPARQDIRASPPQTFGSLRASPPQRHSPNFRPSPSAASRFARGSPRSSPLSRGSPSRGSRGSPTMRGHTGRGCTPPHRPINPRWQRDPNDSSPKPSRQSPKLQAKKLPDAVEDPRFKKSTGGRPRFLLRKRDSPKLKPSNSIKMGKGPDGTNGFRWKRNGNWKPTDKTPQLNPEAPRFSPSLIPSLAKAPPKEKIMLSRDRNGSQGKRPQVCNTGRSVMNDHSAGRGRFPGPPQQVTLLQLAQKRSSYHRNADKNMGPRKPRAPPGLTRKEA